MKDRDWFMPKHNDMYYYQYRVKEKENNKKFKVKYCNSCNKAYEKSWENTGSIINYYDDFVTYGLERSKCERCSKSS